MGATPTFQLPYPEATDPADVPLDMKELADRVEAILAPLAYQQFAGSVVIASVAEAAPNDIVSAPAVAFDGSPVWVEFFAPVVQPAVNGGVYLCLYQDGASLGRLGPVFAPSGPGTLLVPFSARRRITPSAAAHTIKVGAFQSGAGNGTVIGGNGGAGAYVPGFIRITR